mgnify:CR=1 FL=1
MPDLPQEAGQAFTSVPPFDIFLKMLAVCIPERASNTGLFEHVVGVFENDQVTSCAIEKGGTRPRLSKERAGRR